MTPVRIGVIGVGALALRAILPHLTQEDVREQVSVQALCDPVLERAHEAAARYGIPISYASLDDLLADESVDAVTIASPIGLHYEHCRRALQAGKHVHVNKTMCITVTEADEVIELAHARELRIVASPGEVLRPQLRRTRELIEQGAIGELAWVICGGSFESYHEQHEPERFEPPGSTTADSHSSTARPPVPCRNNSGRGIYFGTRGMIEGVLLNGEPFDFPGRELTAGAPVTDWEAQMRVLPHVRGPHRAIPEAHVFEDVMQLVDWVADGTPSPVTAEHARHVIDVIESGFRAAESGVTQNLTTSWNPPQ